jgi:hypothetical protein
LPRLAGLAKTLLKRRQLRPHGVEHPHQVDIDDLARFLDRRPWQRHHVVHNPGIVDGDIEPAEFRQRLSTSRSDSSGSEMSPPTAICLPAKFIGQRVKPVRSEIAEHELCPSLREMPAAACPKPPVAPVRMTARP